MRYYITTLLLVFLVGPVSAESIPRYDVDTYCRIFLKPPKGVEATPSTASDRYETCFAQNQKTYDILKSIWEATQGWQQDFCIREVDKKSIGSYGDLLGCVRRVQVEQEQVERRLAEEERNRQIPKREFRY